MECRRLHLSGASHCRFLDPVLNEFLDGLRSVRFSAPQRPYISNVTGTWVRAEDAVNPEYWARHFRHCVRFAQGMDELLRDPGRVLVEVGPGRTLTSLSRQQERKPAATITTLRHPDEDFNDVAYIRTAAGRLWAAGIPIEWPRILGPSRRRRIPLPTYPFEHQTYWLEPSKAESSEVLQTVISKLESQEEWFFRPTWKSAQLPMDSSRPALSAQPTLVFLDGAGLGTRIAQRLRTEGNHVITVREGDAFYKFNDDEYALAAEEGRAGYDQLVAELASSGRLPGRILHLWLVTRDRSHRPGSSFFHRNQERGIYSLLFLAQALGEQEAPGNIHIDVVTTGMQSVSGESVEHPEKATVCGPLRVIPRELPHISWRGDRCHPSRQSGSQSRGRVK